MSSVILLPDIKMDDSDEAPADEIIAETVEEIDLDPDAEVDEEYEPDEEERDDDDSLKSVFVKEIQKPLPDERHTIPYRKLVVPQTMRSVYWKYFGFPANESDEILTRVKIVCLLCRTQIAYNRNTSNLRMHLQNRHNKELVELEAATPPKKPVISQELKDKRLQKKMLKAAMNASGQHIYTTEMAGTVHIGPADIQLIPDPNVTYTRGDGVDNTQKLIVINGSSMNHGSMTNNQNVAFILTDENEQEADTNPKKSVSDALLEFLIMDLQLPMIVQGPGFQRLIATLKAPCNIPSKNLLEEDIIPRYYDTFKESLKSIISNVTTEISLIVEEWNHNCGEEFFTFSMYHQVSSEARLEFKVLRTIHGPRDWSQFHWENIIAEIFQEWSINPKKVTATVVSTNRQTLTNALTRKGLIVIPCLLNSLQVCAQACFDDPTVSNILTRCREIIGLITSHPEITTALATHDQLLGTEENSLVLDQPSMWISTYRMLQQLILRRDVLTSLLANVDNFSNLDYDQWQIICDLVEVLEPFKVTIITLSEEKIPLLSLMKPLIWQLMSSHLKVKDDDSCNAQSFKTCLSEMLSRRFSDPNISLLLQIATTLDPRFKEVSYASEEEKKSVTLSMRGTLAHLIEVRGENVVEESSPVKKSRLSGMELLLGGLRSSKKEMTSQEKADLELAQYQSEPTAPLDYCPLQWWAKECSKCPNLGVLASRYNCVPVCCPPSQRISFEAMMSYNAKRAALPTHLLDQLLFLNANHNIV